MNYSSSGKKRNSLTITKKAKKKKPAKYGKKQPKK
tara:strand:- start:6817 stop:6921 length:105 start_codon:yes stop_codon:yes gene_type:complete